MARPFMPREFLPSVCSCLLLMLLLSLPTVTPVAAEEVAEAAPDRIVVVALTNALGEGKPLELHLAMHGERVTHAFALARRFNRAAHLVDASLLRWVNPTMRGEVRVTIQPDGYLPRDGKPIAFQCLLDLAADPHAPRLVGRYTGALGDAPTQGDAIASLAPAPDPAAPAFITLDCENAAFGPKSDKPQSRRLRLNLAVRDGQGHACTIDPPGSITDVSFGALVEKADARLTSTQLTAQLDSVLKHQSGEVQHYRQQLTGQVIGNTAIGAIATVRDGQPQPAGTFIARIDREPPPSPGDALPAIVLHDALGPGKYLKLYLSARHGIITHGFAASPNFNNATHLVDTTGLKLDAHAIRGEVAVTVLPDPWVPADHQPIQCAWTLDARTRDRAIVGQYHGRAGTTTVTGPLDGQIDPRPADAPVTRITLKVEDALFGGNEYQNRAFLTFDLADGKVVGGKVSNNHTPLTGSVTGGSVTLHGDDLAALLTATIHPGGNATPGQYTFTLEGKRLGPYCAGSFRSTREGHPATKSGRYWASLSPPP